ncbi:hypothetical protein Lmor_0562 [Legionella moravica]|uniref:Uncharacterized protein n=2 Tax=Legionella moravica TaxID=39962 RepID=A0A378JWW5_9GAMM|nr:hypothetical protein Lmor_0562 [Legionella moravica]STX63153.1 Uncharacterised protein [Legionella moravica]
MTPVFKIFTKSEICSIIHQVLAAKVKSMTKRRVPVYGFDSDEKNFILQLLAESEQYSFENNSPEQKFKYLTSFTPHSILSLQIFVLNLADKRFRQPPEMVRPCLGCYFSRSVLLILHGEDPEILDNYELSYHDKDNIQIIHSKNIKELNPGTIHDALNQLEKNEEMIAEPTIFSASY